jgi:hypothetical protein
VRNDERASTALVFFFEAEDVRSAVGLAGDLRLDYPSAVLVRPGPLRLLRSRKWQVTVRTRATWSTPEAVGRREEAMRMLLDHHPGCTLTGWQASP